MPLLYKITNTVNSKVYVGMTRTTLSQRMAGHKYAAKSANTPLYYAMRKYGFDNFKFEVLYETDDVSTILVLEIECIDYLHTEGIDNYNVAKGGEGGFCVPIDKRKSWRDKLCVSRKGRTPAKGLKHTTKTKELCRIHSKRYWETQSTYDSSEISKYSFKEAAALFGISKTHYYRLRRNHV